MHLSTWQLGKLLVEQGLPGFFGRFQYIDLCDIRHAFDEQEGRQHHAYSSARARKDKHKRARGLLSLEAKVKSGKLTKGYINNRGYNKYLRIEGEANIQIDYEKYESDNQWDGLKGYLTNSKLPAPLSLSCEQSI